MTGEKYVIAAIKTWNTDNGAILKNKGEYDVELITDPQELTAEKIGKIKPRYIFFPHWSWKIPAEIYDNWECVVFHMTDLPFGRGGSPLQNLIVRGIKETKISALKVAAEMDAGPIYLKKGLVLDGSAAEILKRASGIIYREMIPFIIKNEPVPQAQTGEPVLFKRRAPEQSDLAPLASLAEVYDQIRMVDAEGYPRAFLETGEIRYEFSAAEDLGDRIKAEVIIKRREK